MSDSVHHGPLADATVIAAPVAASADTVFHAARTDARGRYTIDGLRAGRYVISVEHAFTDSDQQLLETLAASVGPVPRVLLRDTDPGAEPPVHRPGSPEMPDPADRAARLRLLGEIARGGMGAVLKGRDSDIG